MSDSSVPITVRKFRNRSREDAKNMSWNCSAVNSIGPTVGRPITSEVMISPETITGSSQPMVLMIGLMATRTGYLNSRLPSRTPLARAVITYCFSSSSSSVARITRMMPAVPAVPTMTIGSGRCFSRSHTLATLHGAFMYSGENSPPGLMPRASSPIIRIRASRKLGVARPMKPMNEKK